MSLIHLISFFTIFLPLEPFESAKAVSVGATSKGVSKVGRSAANGVSKQGNRPVSSVCLIFICDYYEMNNFYNCLFHHLNRGRWQQRALGWNQFLSKI